MNETIPSKPQEEDPNSPTQPGKRLRKLIAGSETNEATMAQRAELGQTSPQPGAEPPLAASKPPTLEAQGDENAPAPSKEPLSSAAESPSPTSAPLSSAPLPPAPADSAPVSDTQRHPTGAPESTGGWYTPGQTGVYGAEADSAQTRAVPPQPSSSQLRAFWLLALDLSDAPHARPGRNQPAAIQ